MVHMHATIVIVLAAVNGACGRYTHKDEGVLLSHHNDKRMHCTPYEDCVLRGPGEEMRVLYGRVEVTVQYDTQGPFLAVNATIAATSSITTGRYMFSLTYLGEGEAHGAEIMYRGDKGYDMCCRFLHGSFCVWGDDGKQVPVLDSCSFSSFVGSVRKPLPHTAPGLWEAGLHFYSNATALGSVALPFLIDINHLSKMVHLQQHFHRPDPIELPSSAADDEERQSSTSQQTAGESHGDQETRRGNP